MRSHAHPARRERVGQQPQGPGTQRRARSRGVTQRSPQAMQCMPSPPVARVCRRVSSLCSQDTAVSAELPGAVTQTIREAPRGAWLQGGLLVPQALRPMVPGKLLGAQ